MSLFKGVKTKNAIIDKVRSNFTVIGRSIIIIFSFIIKNIYLGQFFVTFKKCINSLLKRAADLCLRGAGSGLDYIHARERVAECLMDSGDYQVINLRTWVTIRNPIFFSFWNIICVEPQFFNPSI